MIPNLPKNWLPDPNLSKLLKPYYNRGFTASAVSTFLIRDEDGNTINYPNVKEYYLYWRYWKYIDSQKILCSIRAYVKAHQKNLEKFYLSQYDKLILVSYGIEKTLDDECNNTTNNDVEHLENNIDVELETLSLKIIQLESKILIKKYITENNLILYYFKFNYSKLLQRIITATHKMLIRILNFFSKRRAKKFILDCQCQNKKPDQTIIKCGICAAEIIPLTHLTFC